MSAALAPTRRLLAWVEALKRGRFPNARSLARELTGRGAGRVSSRSLQRDLDHLRLRLDAPIEYDAVRHGYALVDAEWVFPLEALQGSLLYASVLGTSLSLPAMPEPLRLPMEQVLKAQLTAADPEDIDAGLLQAIVFATGAHADLSADVFEAVHRAWRETRRLRLVYESGSADGTNGPREVDVHALFLSQGAWYARVYCHLRQGLRSLAIHRIRDPVVLPQAFRRSPDLVRQVRAGNIFDYETVADVVIECSPDKARILREREWFPGQTSEPLPDGRLRLHFPAAPRPDLVYWILSYCGHLVARHPPDLVAEVRAHAHRILSQHPAPEGVAP